MKLFQSKKKEEAKTIKMKVIEAIFNTDLCNCQLPYNNAASFVEITQQDFDAYALDYKTRVELCAFEMSLYTWSKMIKKTGCEGSVIDLQDFRNFLFTTKAGSEIYTNSEKLVKSRIIKNLTYKTVVLYSNEFDLSRKEKLALRIGSLVVFFIMLYILYSLIF